MVDNKTYKKTKRKWTNSQFQLLTLGLPAIALIFVFAYIPMFGIIIAFKDYKYNKGILGSDFVGFKNFEFFFKSSDATRVIRNTLLYNFSFIILGIIVAVTLAILLSNIRKKGAIKIYQSTLFLPYFLSWVVIAYMSLSFFDFNSGILNTFIINLGGKPISWYSETKYWPFILIFFNIWKSVGYNTLVYYSSIIGIDESLFEAARIDGCSNLKSIRYITIPMIRPTIIMLAILAIGGIFRADFGLFYQIPQNSGALMSVTDVVDTYIFRALMVTGNAGIAAAVGLIQSSVGVLLVLGTNYLVGKIEKESTLF